VRLYNSTETVSHIVTDGKDGDALQLEKVGQLFKFSLWTDRVFSPEYTLDRSFRERLSQISFSCSKKYISHKKSNRELYLWSFDEKTAN